MSGYSRNAAQAMFQPAYREVRPMGDSRVDIEMSRMNAEDSDYVMEKSSEVKRLLQDVEPRLQALRQRYGAALQAVRTDQRAMQTNIEMERSAVSTMLHTAKNLIQEIDRTVGSPNFPESDRALWNNQLRPNLVSKLTSRRDNLINVQKQYSDGLQNRARQEYKLVNPDASDYEVEQVLENPQQQIFAAQTNRLQNAQSVMRNVESRRQDLANIERDIVELSQMFNDLNLYIIEQQPTFDKVEELAQNTRTDVENAGTQVDQAIVHQKKARKKKHTACHRGHPADCHRAYLVSHSSQMMGVAS